MAEKILALLAAFALGGVASFFCLTRATAFAMHHSPKLRAKMRAALDQAEREAKEL